MTVTIYHNPKCSKSRATLELLEENGISANIVEYLKAPPSVDELKDILAKLGKEPRDIVRKKEANEEGIIHLDGDALVEALAEHPRAMERPIVTTKDGAAIGRPPESVLALF